MLVFPVVVNFELNFIGCLPSMIYARNRFSTNCGMVSSVKQINVF